MTNKLPAYFEKYFEQKFSDIHDQISELKHHVNDEIEDIKKWLTRLSVFVVGLTLFLTFHDFVQGSMFGWLIRYLGL